MSGLFVNWLPDDLSASSNRALATRMADGLKNPDHSGARIRGGSCRPAEARWPRPDFLADPAGPAFGILGDDGPCAVMDRHDPAGLEQADGLQGVGRAHRVVVADGKAARSRPAAPISFMSENNAVSQAK